MVDKFPNGKFKGVWWMPWLQKAMKDAAWRRNVSGRCLATFDPEISEWGNPICRKTDYVSVTDTCIPGEVKHFSTRRKRKQCTQVQHFLSSGERKGMSPNSVLLLWSGFICLTIVRLGVVRW